MKAYPPLAVGKAEFCKLQKLTWFIMEMITYSGVASGSDCATVLADAPTCVN